jgi:hypothetical protein
LSIAWRSEREIPYHVFTAAFYLNHKLRETAQVKGFASAKIINLPAGSRIRRGDKKGVHGVLHIGKVAKLLPSRVFSISYPCPNRKSAGLSQE